MKPNFALLFTDDAVVLMHRAKRGWLEVGRTPFDAEDLAAAMAFMRSTALGLAPTGVTTKLVIPNSQIKYLTIAAPGPDAITREGQIAEALEGVTPYPVDDLAFDWSGEGELVQVAVVARETLIEAESFAVEHRLNPISFVALPDPGTFGGEPIFGVSEHALAVLKPGEVVDADAEPIWVAGHEPQPAPPPEPVAEPVALAEPVAEAEAEAKAVDILPPPADLPQDTPADDLPLAEPAPVADPIAAVEEEPFAASEVLAEPEPAEAVALTELPADPLPVAPPEVVAEGISTVEEPIEQASAVPADQAAPQGDLFAADQGAVADAPPTKQGGLHLTGVTVNLPPPEAPPVVIAVPPTPVVTAPEVTVAEVAAPEVTVPPVEPAPVPAAPALDINTDPLAKATARIVADRAKSLQTGAPARPAVPSPRPDPAPAAGLIARAKTLLGRKAKAPAPVPPAKPVAEKPAGPTVAPDATKTAPKAPAAPAPKPAPKKADAAAKADLLVAEKPAIAAPVPDKPAADKPVVDKPVDAKPVAAKPATDRPASEKTLAEKLAAPAVTPIPPAAAQPAKAQAQKAKAQPAKAPVFAAPKPAKKRNMGLILTGALLLVLALAAAGSSFYVSLGDSSSDTETAAADLPTAEDEIAADLPEEDFPPADQAAPAADATTAATTTAQPDLAAPEAIDPAPAAELAADPATADEIFLATADAPPRTPGAAALQLPTEPVENSGAALANAATAPPLPPTLIVAPPAPAPEPEAATATAPDLITPTPEGAKTPQGVTLFAGKPPIVPPPRPGSEVATQPGTANPAAIPANAALAAIRPQPRPADLAPAAAPAPDAAPDAALATLAAMRPAPRPEGLAQPTAPDATAAPQAGDPSLALLQPDGEVAPLGLGPRLSPRPPARPEDMDQAIQDAVAAASQPDPAPTPEAEQEPETNDGGPRTPTSANVAKEATVKNAIDLSDLNLIGIYGPDSNHYAMVRKPNGRYERVEVGDRLDGGKVRSITATEVRYEKRGKIVVLTMPRG